MKFNKLYLLIGILYLSGFVMILLNFLTKYLNLSALCVLSVASVLLTICLAKSCKQQNAIINSQVEEIIMEIAMQDGEEKYVVQKPKQKGFKRLVEFYKIYSPAILSAVAAGAFIFMLIMFLIKM